MSKKTEQIRREKMAGGVTLRDMEQIAINMEELNDLGNIIDITDSNDTLGLGMLANPKMSNLNEGNTYSVPTTNSMNSGFGSGFGGGLGDIELTQLDEGGPPPMTLNLGGGGSGGYSSAPIDIEFKRAESDKVYGNAQTASGPTVSLSAAPSNYIAPEQEKKEKIEYLNKLQRLEQKGFSVSRRFTMDNSLDEMKQEYMRLMDARHLETSLRFQRQALIGVVTGLEWLNGRFDPFDVKLDGWSESVHENVEDFDEVFEELYDKYKDRGKMPPELRLMTALAGSGFICHVSNSFLKSRMPSADDVLRQNPELARQFAAAAAQSAGPGFGNFMGMAMGVPSQGGSAPSPSNGPTGAFFQGAQQQQQMRSPQAVASVESNSMQQTARREMRGPTGVDDILRTFEDARARELNEIPPSNGNQAAVAAVEMQSVMSDDMQSAAESTRTGRTGGRRKRQAVGNTVSLAV